MPPKTNNVIPAPTTEDKVNIEPATTTSTIKVDDSSNSVLEWTEALGDYVPLFQTLLWVFVIVWLIKKFSSELMAIVGAIKGRIVEGAAIKAGPVEIAQFVRPQSPSEQVARIKEESDENPEYIAESCDKYEISSSKSGYDYFHRRYFFAEDLVLRKLQEEYKSLMSRQVTSGDGVEFDGFFVKDNQPYGVEVKYAPNRINISQYVKTAQQIHSQVQNVHWKRFTLIFAVVIEEDNESSLRQLIKLKDELDQLGLNTILRFYKLSDLANQYSIDVDK